MMTVSGLIMKASRMSAGLFDLLYDSQFKNDIRACTDSIQIRDVEGRHCLKHRFGEQVALV
jgi:hypothetical protein